MEDAIVIETMRKYGGGFIKALAEAAAYADEVNLGKIKAVWPDDRDTYSEPAYKQQEQEQARDEAAMLLSDLGLARKIGTGLSTTTSEQEKVNWLAEYARLISKLITRVYGKEIVPAEIVE